MVPKPNQANIHFGWIRLLYICTALMGLGTGLIILIAPEPFARKVIGLPSTLPPQDRVTFGLIGCFWLAMGVMALLGLRAPLRFLPIFLVQLIYKTCWYLFVFAPLVISGDFPVHGGAIAVANALWIAMDVKAIPFAYLLSRDPTVAQPPTEHDTGVALTAALSRQ